MRTRRLTPVLAALVAVAAFGCGSSGTEVSAPRAPRQADASSEPDTSGGTQVVRSQFRRTEALSSLNDDIIKAGQLPSTRLLEFCVGSLEEQDVRDAIDAAAVHETEFIKIRRLRLADDVPLAILTNYLPTRFELTEEDLRTKSLYACLRSLGVNLKIAHQQISARLMTEEEAELLDEETPAACLTVDRLAYDDVGQFVEFGRHMYHAAHYSIQSSLVV